MHVLVVDDSEAIRLTLSALFEDAGHAVTEADSLAQARRLLDGAYDAVLLDVNLGDGLGTQLVPELAGLPSRPVVVVLTGAPLELLGVDAVIEKAGDPEEIVRRVERLVKARSL